jgi:hypothetical protein
MDYALEAALAASLKDRPRRPPLLQPEVSETTPLEIALSENAHTPSATWMAVVNSGDGSAQGCDFEPREAAELETAWRAAVTTGGNDAQGMVLSSRLGAFAIDFRAMTQTNLETGTVRPLHRFGSAIEDLWADAFPSSTTVGGFVLEPLPPVPPPLGSASRARAAAAEDGTDAAIAAALAELDEAASVAAAAPTTIVARHPWHPQHRLMRTGRAGGWRCDGMALPGGCSGGGGGSGGPRYRCQNGCDFDLCQACWDSPKESDEGNDSSSPCTELGSDDEDDGRLSFHDSEGGSGFIDLSDNDTDFRAVLVGSSGRAANSAFVDPATATASPPECVICLTPIPSCEVLALPCIHVFHRSCVLTWLAASNTCPVCKHAVDVDLG